MVTGMLMDCVSVVLVGCILNGVGIGNRDGNSCARLMLMVMIILTMTAMLLFPVMLHADVIGDVGRDVYECNQKTFL